MDPWFYWLIGSVLLVVLELVFSGFVLLCFSFAALAACIVTFLDGGLKLQILSFTEEVQESVIRQLGFGP